MTIEEIKWLTETAGKFTLGALIGAGIMFLFLKNYLTSYLNEKGANLAKKEDIGELTKLVRDVEHDYNVLIKQIDAKQLLRMAAVDQRLKAHQEAFTLWRKLTVPVEGEVDSILQCQDWWEKNCIYLEPEVRQAFVTAYSSAHLHRALAQGYAPSEQIIEAHDKVMVFQNILFNAVQLPPLSPEELKTIPITN